MNRQVADRERYLGSGNAIGVAAAALARRPVLSQIRRSV